MVNELPEGVIVNTTGSPVYGNTHNHEWELLKTYNSDYSGTEREVNICKCGFKQTLIKPLKKQS